jgi:hypothetical protein
MESKEKTKEVVRSAESTLQKIERLATMLVGEPVYSWRG